MAKVSHDSNKNQLEWEGAKVDSLGGIAIFRLLLETQTTLNEYKIIGLNFRNTSLLAAARPGKRVITFAAESSRS
ncbi:MAG: hypothetical protein WAW52_04735 [Methanothrix sp.]